VQAYRLLQPCRQMMPCKLRIREVTSHYEHSQPSKMSIGNTATVTCYNITEVLTPQ
jgi:hypothetical protein